MIKSYWFVGRWSLQGSALLGDMLNNEKWKSMSDPIGIKIHKENKKKNSLYHRFIQYFSSVNQVQDFWRSHVPSSFIALTRSSSLSVSVSVNISFHVPIKHMSGAGEIYVFLCVRVCVYLCVFVCFKYRI